MTNDVADEHPEDPRLATARKLMSEAMFGNAARLPQAVELVARSAAEHLGVSLAFTGPMKSDTPTIAKCRVADTEQALAIARAAIEAMADHPVFAAMRQIHEAIPKYVHPEPTMTADEFINVVLGAADDQEVVSLIGTISARPRQPGQ